MKRTIAATEALLIFPATLFMTALFVRNLQPQQYEPARSAQAIVMWFASTKGAGLWTLLIGLPIVVLLLGATTVMRDWATDATLRAAAVQTLAAMRAHFATLFVALATVTSAGILSAVAIHVLTD